MPIIDTQDARELDSHLQRFFDSAPAERPHRLRQLFTEKFDFNPASGKISLANAPRNTALPPDADRIASIEGINVVYVSLQIPDTVRVRKAEAMAASRMIAGQLGDDMLLLLTNEQGNGVTQLHVVLPTLSGSAPALRRMVIERYLPRRTALQQLSNIYHHWQRRRDIRLALEEAFNVEAVTSAFFEQYRYTFEQVQRLVKGFPATDDGHEDRKLFVQTLFNRLMFIYFLSRKGWLKFKGDPDYLAALWNDYQKNKGREDFYTERLRNLFFVGLNDPRAANLLKDSPTLHALIGDVPFLNGGLFAREEQDDRSGVTVPDEAISAVLDDLFDRYNFTVAESTPLDQEVAVDPEMLGKVFEELVTGRHETGSYYTPRPVVSFMCRESLKGYLQEAVTTLPVEAIERFVDDHDVSRLDLTSAEKVRRALEQIKVVDPACGSGAYLLGMMHELVELETALYSEKLLMDAKSLYDLKLRIIEENVYGVDLDPFAVNIAMLRLWLTLAIEYGAYPPPPLPNLDFKIVCGDSLLGPDPNPDTYGTLFRHRVHGIASQLVALKGRHMKATDQERINLYGEIGRLQDELREALTDAAVSDEAVDWRVVCAEVFYQTSGFHVVLANPPYVRADAQFRHIEDEDERHAAIAKWKEYRAALLKAGGYQTLYEKWDLYLPFLERAHQLLRAGGRMVFIISDAYNAAKYATKSHEFFLKNACIERVDFCSDIPLFDAGISNTIVHFSKSAPDSGHQPLRIGRRGASPEDFERGLEVLPTAPQAEFGAALFRASGAEATKLSVGGDTLGQICYISWGLRPCSDERHYRGAFRACDVIADARDAQHPKPYVENRDTVKWWICRLRYLEWGTERAPIMFARPTFPELYEVPEKLMAAQVCGRTPRAVYDNTQLIHNHSMCCLVPWHYLEGVRNKSIQKTAKYRDEVKPNEVRPPVFREDLEQQSQRFPAKYLLAIMNSSWARDWLAARRRSTLHVYPDDWKPLPIVSATAEEQAMIIASVDEILGLFERDGYPLTSQSQSRLRELEQQIDDRTAKLYRDRTPG